jgi:hypothetical protein
MFCHDAGNNSKSDEQRGNVYENKGPTFHSPGQSGNVYENKGTYPLKSGNVIEKTGVSA